MNIKNAIKVIKGGTFNMKEYVNSYNDPKQMNAIDPYMEYLAQLPYLKVITFIPVPMLFFISFVIFISPAIFYMSVDKIHDIYKKLKGTK